jgi:hypothetical protein
MELLQVVSLSGGKDSTDEETSDVLTAPGPAKAEKDPA